MFGVVLGSAGFAAGRVARSAPPEAPVCAAKVEAPIRVAVAHDDAVEAASDDGSVHAEPFPDGTITIAPTPDDDGMDVADVLARAQQQARDQPRAHNAIVGHVTEAASGEALAGCTIVVTSPALQGAQTAISDEHGDFKISDLPAASYLVTYYYNDITVERSGMSVSELGATDASQRIDLQHPVVITDDYIVNIPTGRTFEGVVAADGESFSSNDTLENTYVIDGDEQTLTLPQ